MPRYIALKTFIGADGIHRRGEPVFRRQGLPIDTWISRGLIAEVPDPVPTERPVTQPTNVPVKEPEKIETPGPSETKTAIEPPEAPMTEPTGESTGINVTYRCGDCDAVFPNRAALNGHRASHRRSRKG